MPLLIRYTEIIEENFRIFAGLILLYIFLMRRIKTQNRYMS